MKSNVHFKSIRQFSVDGTEIYKGEIIIIDYSNNQILIIPTENNNIIDRIEFSEEKEKIIKNNSMFLLVC